MPALSGEESKTCGNTSGCSEQTMNPNDKLSLLEKVYGLYDRFTEGLDVSCRPRCCTCCTTDVVMTTLEGFFILKNATAEQKKWIMARLIMKPHPNRFRPEITLNRMGELYAQGKEIPEEKDHLPDGVCPLLEKGLCSIYPIRPFGCRCLISKHVCKKTGFAEMDFFWVTVNTLFLQFIEHIDATGLTGNLTDVLLFYKTGENVPAYEKIEKLPRNECLVQNQPIRMLLVPSEHQKQAEDIYCELQQVVLGSWRKGDGFQR
jgi:hypothetical protein